MKSIILSILFGAVSFGMVSTAIAEQSDTVKVFKMYLQSEIDARSSRYVDLALTKAENNNSDYVVIEMDTYGGALDAADDIRTRILEFDIPVYVYINKDAASAGALISIACDSIYMSSASSIGAATVVTQDGAAAPDKYQSYMRSIMRSTAEAKGRDPQIAEAMVDETIEVDSISSIGKVITFSTSEAIKHGFCEAEVSGLDEIMSRSGIEKFEIIEYELSASDKIIDLFINPYVSGILILVILGGIYFELQTPGVGFPILASIVALVFYLTPYYLNGLAQNWEIALFVLGLALIALEVFVIPGFGVAGLIGICMTVGSLILVMLENDWFDFTFVAEGDLITAVFTTFLALIGSFIIMFIGGVRITESRMFKRVALQTTLDSANGYTSNFKKESFLGKKGTAYTILRPSGKVMIEDELYDAFTRGGYIEQGTEVEVIAEEANSLKVKAVS
ncbi:NfeD family protein [Reichenbachiella versicolor]|uniref:NfeD family protein n=1 Tax=Reichenbachiella versicolor TaxID=1821036 RepID=UPI000D6E11F8|nr:NfeD family protein [Reichenbachiella versicolor]